MHKIKSIQHKIIENQDIMKKSALLLLLLLLSSTALIYSQNTDSYSGVEDKNELKINTFNLIAFKWLAIDYERIITEESSFGVGTLFSLANDSDGGFGEYRTFSIAPYYRHFFSKKYVQGFFIEGFGMLHSGKYENYHSGCAYTTDKDKYTDFAVGVSAGSKFVTKRGFIAEIYLGIGRNMLGKSSIEVVGRGGISLGFRF